MAMSDAELEALSHAKFWDERYAAEKEAAAKKDTTNPDDVPESSENTLSEGLGTFEWFRSFSDLQPFFSAHLRPPDTTPRILHLGCGNSSLTSDLWHIGYRNQTSVDFSQIVIDAMSKKYHDLGQRWAVEDVRDLTLESGSMDVAIDKGTLDAMIHGSPWDPPEDVVDNISRYNGEVARVLRPGGRWLYITYRQPHFMRRHLEREGIWEVKMEVLGGEGGGFEYFGWVLTKL
jgi:SAM-dependent methyltransferase